MDKFPGTKCEKEVNICANVSCRLRKAGCRGFEGCPGYKSGSYYKGAVSAVKQRISHTRRLKPAATRITSEEMFSRGSI